MINKANNAIKKDRLSELAVVSKGQVTAHQPREPKS